MTELLIVGGAVATASPALVAASGTENALIRVAALIVAVTAIGVGATKVWRLTRRLVHLLDRLEKTLAEQPVVASRLDDLDAGQLEMLSRQDKTDLDVQRLAARVARIDPETPTPPRPALP